jgi:hypothetical protein
VCVVNATLQPFYHREGNPLPIVQEAGWDASRSVGVQKISPPPGFDPRTVHPLEIRNTDYATILKMGCGNMVWVLLVQDRILQQTLVNEVIKSGVEFHSMCGVYLFNLLQIPSRNTTMSEMTNLDYSSDMFRLILSHHQADIRLKQSGCPHNIFFLQLSNGIPFRYILSHKLYVKACNYNIYL